MNRKITPPLIVSVARVWCLPFRLFLLTLSLLLANSEASAGVISAINCGGGAVTSSDGIEYAADQNFSGGTSGSLAGEIHGSTAPTVHATYRTSGSAFSYSITTPNDDYVVDLLFADDQALGLREFDIALEGAGIFSDYDIRANAPIRTEVVASIPVTVSDGVLDITITAGSVGSAKLSAIVVRTPEPTGALLPDLGFGNMVLVDEIDCGDVNDTHEFVEYPVGATQIQTILGDQMRVMPNPSGGDVRYFAYRIGENANLEAGKPYLLQIDYPEDVARTMYVINSGACSARGFHTGNTIGDALNPPYVVSNPESLDIPLSGNIETWQNMFHLHDRFAGLDHPRNEGDFSDLPEDGFLVIIAMTAEYSAPMSSGAAISAIRLYEAPDANNYSLDLNLPPEELRHRHLFYREEMADGVVYSYDPTMRGVADTLDWYRYKAERMKFLGMNTYTLNLLEFGSNQGFDSGPGGGISWYYTAREPERWGRLLDLLEAQYDFDVLPYYEYAGSLGAGNNEVSPWVPSLGSQKRAQPLKEMTNYTHVGWAEKSRADLADQDTIEDAKLLLDVTMTRYKDKVNFIGAWFRARVSQMPISFNENNFQQFAEEANEGVPISRQQLIDSTALYNQYKAWWFTKRREFINEMRDHLREQGINKEANILFTSDATETGKASVPNGQEELIAEDVSEWAAINIDATDLDDALAVDRHYYGLTTPRDTWAGWEWQHADAENDPYNYTANEGGMLTYSFNRYYTVADADSLDAFRTPSGLAAVRHFCLNENTMTEDFGGANEQELLGYFVADCEYAQSFSMMEEALAFANGDPRYIGFLCSARYNPGFPQYVRAFNRAFLALPAEPSTLLNGASSDAAVVVRSITTDGFGRYLGVVNTARTEKTVTITLPERGMLYDAATNAVIDSNTDSVTLTMYPFELRSLRLDKQTLDGAVAYDDAATVDEGASIDVDVLSNDTGPGSLSISAIGQPRHGVASIVNGEIRYTPNDGYFGTDSLWYSVSNGVDDDRARLNITVSNTATANDLSAWGLSAFRVGNYVEIGSRVLADGNTGELSGSARGFTGTSDSAYFENASLLGDFTMTVKVDDSTSLANGSMGLMIRQANATDSRFAAIGIDASGEAVYYSRSEKGGSATEGTYTSSVSWLRMVRTGKLIEMQVSSDGSNFTTIGNRVFPGLPVKVEAGLYLTGGDINNPVRGLVTNFAISNQSLGASVLFAQGFDDGSNLATYEDASPSQNQFSEIVAESEGGEWSIENGQLRIVRESSSSSDAGAGIARLAPFAGPPSVLKLSFDFGVSGSSTNGGMMNLIVGDFSSVSDHSSAGSSAGKLAQFEIRGRGVGSYHFSINGSNIEETPANGAMSPITAFINNSGSTQSYEGPDGELHSLDHYHAAYWLNDKILAANLAPPGTYSASAIETFRFQIMSSDNADIRLDNIVAESVFIGAGGNLSNTAPVAVADSVTVDEGNAVLIAPLGNDSDPDNGPAGLSLVGFTSPAHGVITQIDNQLRYEPYPGFYGSDSLSYTVSDGNDSDTATISISVSDTSLASNLTSLSLSGANIGFGSGNSRLLASGEGELNLTGGSVNGANDTIWFEHQTFSGNFIMDVRMIDLAAKGTPERAGLMVRESLAPGARTVYLAGDENGQCFAGLRDSLNAIMDETLTAEALVYPAARLRIERFEDTITTSVSMDGINYTDTSSTSLSGLSESLEIGLFAANARFILDDFQVLPWQDALFVQDFSSSTDFEDYYNGVLPGRNQFTDISAESDGGNWSIDSGALKLVRPGINNANNGAGFHRLVDFEGSPNILRVSFDVGISNSTGNYDYVKLQFGQWASVTDYNNTGASASHANQLTFRGGGTETFRFRLTGQSSGHYDGDGSLVHVVWYINNSGATQTYVGPDSQSHTVDHNAESVWADGVKIFDNVTRSGGYTINDIQHMRLLCSTPHAITFWLDNLMIEDTFLVNDAPVAVNDVATTDEQTAVAINVLSNDSDSDSQPSALSIHSYSQGTNGSVSQSGSQLTYTPNPGFHGIDSFTYLVTDGAEQDWASVTVTVNSATQNANLSSLGLSGNSIGSDSAGSGRILTSGEIELSGAGSGLSGSSDAFYFESDAITGDFTMIVQVRDIWSEESNALAGLMLRESNAGGSRTVALATSLSSNYIVLERAVADTAMTATTTTETYSYPDAWLLLERVGDVINLAVSSSGSSFTQIDSITLNGLAGSVQAGLFSSSGSSIHPAVATMDDYELTLSSAIFVQTFDSSTNVSNYYSASNPSANQFDDISAEVDGGTWSIDGNELKLVRAGLSGQDAGAGFMRYTDLPGSADVLKIEFNLSVEDIGTYMDLAYLRIGDYSSQRDYSTGSASVLSTFELTIKGGGTDHIRFRLDGTNTSNYDADGTSYYVVWYLNASGASTSYVGPDSSTYILDNLKSSLWVDGVQVFNNVSRNPNFGSTHLSDFYFRFPTSEPATFELDNLTISDEL